MEFIYFVILVVFASFAATLMFLFFGWLAVDRYYLRKNFLKILCIRKDGSYTHFFARKISDKTKDGKYSIAKFGNESYMYKPELMKTIFTYPGFVVYEQSFMAIDFDMKKLDWDSKISIHPQHLEEFLNAKLISELLDNKEKLIIILIIVAIVIGLGCLGSQIYYGQTEKELLNTILGNITVSNTPIKLG